MDTKLDLRGKESLRNYMDFLLRCFNLGRTLFIVNKYLY